MGGQWCRGSPMPTREEWVLCGTHSFPGAQLRSPSLCFPLGKAVRPQGRGVMWLQGRAASSLLL